MKGSMVNSKWEKVTFGSSIVLVEAISTSFFLNQDAAVERERE